LFISFKKLLKLRNLPAGKARGFVVEHTQPHTSQLGGVPEKERITLHLLQDRFSVIAAPRRTRVKLKY
jgi:hypothetical protein